MTDQGIGKSVAFIGLGRMGLPMACNLIAKGFRVRGFDLSEASRNAFAERGGEAAGSAQDAVRGAGVVITMLPTSAIVSDTLLGAGDALAAAEAGTLVIDMSSSRPEDTLALGAVLAPRGIDLVDAPVSGGVAKAVSGKLAIMVGGGKAAEAMPYLEAMGSEIFVVGALGAGHAMKVLNNYVSAAGAIAAMEALVVGQSFGIEQATINKILNASTGRNNTTENKVEKFVLSGAYNSGFDMSLMAKDVGIAEELARNLGLTAPLLVETSSLWKAADIALGKGADHTEIYRFVEQSSARG